MAGASSRQALAPDKEASSWFAYQRLRSSFESVYPWLLIIPLSLGWSPDYSRIRKVPSVDIDLQLGGTIGTIAPALAGVGTLLLVPYWVFLLLDPLP
jgi:hypothetical protein